MNLDDVQIRLRPRSHWEALDLGCLMVRRWPFALYASWFVIAGPVFLLTWLFLSSSPVLAIFIVWWLKPVYERLPLVVVSSAIFGDLPELRMVLRNAKAAITPGLLAALTYRRLSPNRAFEAPVLVLEKLSTEKRSARFKTLSPRVGNQSFWLTILGVHIESFLFSGFVVGVYLLIPEQTEIDWLGLLVDNISGEQDWLSNLLAFAAMALVAPIYVASGFSLYLNRRVELEAWDIELGFKRILAKVASGALLVCFCSVTWPLLGDTKPLAEGRSPEASKEIIEQILNEPEFHDVSRMKVPEFLKEYFEREAENDEPVDVEAWNSFLRGMASVMEILLWLSVVAFVIYLIMRFQVWDWVRKETKDVEQRPEMLMGMKISTDSLPEDVVTAARLEWQQDNVREALSLLYRASLAILLSRFDIRFQASDTEGQCLTKTLAVDDSNIVHYFSELTRSWQLLAYAHHQPTDQEFSRLIDAWPFVREAST